MRVIPCQRLVGGCEDGGSSAERANTQLQPDKIKSIGLVLVLFAELDADGSGYLDAEELGVLFKNMRMPMGQRELDDIVDELDVDGNGV